jgi:hypothetical protein
MTETETETLRADNETLAARRLVQRLSTNRPRRAPTAPVQQPTPEARIEVKVPDAVPAKPPKEPVEPLPQNCVFMKAGKTRYEKRVYLVERKPGLWPFIYHTRYHCDRSHWAADDPQSFKLMMPRLLFCVLVENRRVRCSWAAMLTMPYARNKMNTVLYAPPLPNLRHDHSLCLGNYSTPAKMPSSAAVVDNLMTFLEESSWNDDLYDGFRIIKELKLRGIGTWKKRSAGKKYKKLWIGRAPVTRHFCQTAGNMVHTAMMVDR